MSVVIISAAPHSGGEEIAERVAAGLAYRLVGSGIFEAAAREYGVGCEKLAAGMHDPAAWRSMPRGERVVCLAAVEASLLEVLAQEECVCGGLAADFAVARVPHFLRVAARAPLEQRAAAAARSLGLSDSKARALVAKQDKLRRRWVHEIYGEGEPASELSDVVIDVEAGELEPAVARIVDLARQRRYRPTSYSRKLVRDLALAAKVRAAVVTIDADARVEADSGGVRIEVMAPGKEQARAAALARCARSIPNVADVEICFVEDVFARAALSMR
jgi:cytidylate kinase